MALREFFALLILLASSETLWIELKIMHKPTKIFHFYIEAWDNRFSNEMLINSNREKSYSAAKVQPKAFRMKVNLMIILTLIHAVEELTCEYNQVRGKTLNVITIVNKLQASYLDYREKPECTILTSR